MRDSTAGVRNERVLPVPVRACEDVADINETSRETLQVRATHLDEKVALALLIRA